MKIFSKINFLLCLLVGGLIGVGLNGCKKEVSDYGEGLIYMPQATQSGGVNNIYQIPSGNGELTYNLTLDSTSGDILIDLGVLRSGSFKGEDFSVDIVMDEDAANSFVQSGSVMDAVLMPEGSSSLPAKVDVSGNKATFKLAVNSTTLLNDYAYIGKKIVLAVGLANPSKYKISDHNTLVMVVIDVNSVRDMFFQYKDGFLYRKGDKMMLNGTEYKGVGLNISALSSCGAENELINSQEMEELFASLPKNALVRVPAFRGREEATDKIIKAAENHHIKLMLSLLEAENLGCGSFWTSQGFFESGYRDEFLDYASTMADKYKDSPAIGIWEITTKPSAWMGLTAGILKSFYNEVGKEIKLADPNHLVASGLGDEFTVGPSQQAEFYEGVHHSNYIDIGTFHDLDGDIVESWHHAAIYQALKALNKPYVITGIDLSASDVQDCRFNYEGRKVMFENKTNYYLNSGVNIIFTPPLVNDNVNECSNNFDSSDPLYGTAMDYLNTYLK